MRVRLNKEEELEKTGMERGEKKRVTRKGKRIKWTRNKKDLIGVGPAVETPRAIGIDDTSATTLIHSTPSEDCKEEVRGGGEVEVECDRRREE